MACVQLGALSAAVCLQLDVCILWPTLMLSLLSILAVAHHLLYTGYRLQSCSLLLMWLYHLLAWGYWEESGAMPLNAEINSA